MSRIQGRQVRRARRLRHEATHSEGRLWPCVRARRLGGWKWKRQVPFGPYILDLLCVQAALVVELDGGVHSAQAEYDARRSAYLARHGLRVLRFDNDEVLGDLSGVCLRILDACGGPAPSPPGEAGEGEGWGEGGTAV